MSKTIAIRGFGQINLGAWNTWIPTITGFSSAPTVQAARYCLVGKMCTVYFRMTVSTSNAQTFTITLPFAAANTATQIFCNIQTTDSGTAQTTPGRLDTRVNSNIADLYKACNVSATSWTASGNKGANFTVTFEIA